MPTCIIFGAAPSWDYSRLPVAKEPGDLLICADGGYRHALALGLTPDWLVGDFDSLPEGGLADHIVQVRPEKDDTDANLAVLKGRELGYTNFVMYGGLGGRFDHSMANVQMMAGLAKEGIDLRLRDEQSETAGADAGGLYHRKERVSLFIPLCAVGGMPWDHPLRYEISADGRNAHKPLSARRKQ